MCEHCDSLCHTCEGSPSHCLSCIAPLFLINNTCTSTCPAGQYGNTASHQCLPCAGECLECFSGGNGSVCKSCKEGFYLDGEFKWNVVLSQRKASKQLIFLMFNELATQKWPLKFICLFKKELALFWDMNIDTYLVSPHRRPNVIPGLGTKVSWISFMRPLIQQSLNRKVRAASVFLRGLL